MAFFQSPKRSLTAPRRGRTLDLITVLPVVEASTNDGFLSCLGARGCLLKLADGSILFIWVALVHRPTIEPVRQSYGVVVNTQNLLNTFTEERS